MVLKEGQNDILINRNKDMNNNQPIYYNVTIGYP